MKGKIVLISVLLSILWLPVMAQNQDVSDPVREFAVGGSVDSMSVAVMVMDLKTGKTKGSYRVRRSDGARFGDEMRHHGDAAEAGRA